MNVLLKFVNEDLLPSSMDADNSLRTLWISDFFRVTELVEICIQQFMQPNINDKNVIMFIKSRNLVNLEEDIWYELLDSCIEFVSKGDTVSILK